MTQRLFGTTQDGQNIEEYTLQGEGGLTLRCIGYGCRITQLLVPDATGAVADVVWGYDGLAQYEADQSGQGAFIGRYANRIAGASFALDGKTYHLSQNEGRNFLHGSLAHRVFAAQPLGENSITFTYISPDGEDGFPGELWVAVTYTLTEDNQLIMDIHAKADKDTYANFTNHSYFNLAGSNDLQGHSLLLNSEYFLEAGEGLIPTGRLIPTEGGAFDFGQEKPVLRDIAAADPQLAAAGGYDHCFVINKPFPGKLALAAILRHEDSGRSMHVFTTQPAVQLYTANGIDEGQSGKQGRPFKKHGALCLETQHFPDAPHHEDFPSTLLRAKEKFHQSTVLHFGKGVE